MPPAVRREVTAAARWYDERQRGVGDEFLDEVLSIYASIQQDPESYPRHEQYPGRLDIRRCPLKRFPYDVVFLNRPYEIRVIAVGHHQRDPLYWVDRLP
ncbi:MAG TPA: type II toxin-antitoxin system RelE/ParE family toxin [Planctomycetaceae bacterium]|nr:type II toxin-antitoxin system RelE/ParE family toxin [Planctomycetaceae bacterium]